MKNIKTLLTVLLCIGFTSLFAQVQDEDRFKGMNKKELQGMILDSEASAEVVQQALTQERDELQNKKTLLEHDLNRIEEDLAITRATLTELQKDYASVSDSLNMLTDSLLVLNGVMQKGINNYFVCSVNEELDETYVLITRDGLITDTIGVHSGCYYALKTGQNRIELEDWWLSDSDGFFTGWMEYMPMVSYIYEAGRSFMVDAISSDCRMNHIEVSHYKNLGGPMPDTSTRQQKIWSKEFVHRCCPLSFGHDCN